MALLIEIHTFNICFAHMALKLSLSELRITFSLVLFGLMTGWNQVNLITCVCIWFGQAKPTKWRGKIRCVCSAFCGGATQNKYKPWKVKLSPTFKRIFFLLSLEHVEEKSLQELILNLKHHISFFLSYTWNGNFFLNFGNIFINIKQMKKFFELVSC